MTNERRQLLLKIGAAVCAGLYLLDICILEPSLHAWSEQSDRIVALRQKVDQGRQLLQRESALRERWAGMQQANPPAEESAATNVAVKALSRWERDSQITISGFVPQAQWQSRDDGFKTYECRITANGTQATIGRFLYELESDTTIPVNLEECELATRDARGGQLTLTARITFLQLKETASPTAP
jgi:hypothetical protein